MTAFLALLALWALFCWAVFNRPKWLACGAVALAFAYDAHDLLFLFALATAVYFILQKGHHNA